MVVQVATLMPASYATTPHQQTMRNVADDALARTDGLRMRFTVDRYGSLEAAKRACRSSQTAFASLRTKERRKAQNYKGDGNPRDTNVTGRYDSLMCVTEPVDDGWILRLIPAHVFEDLVLVEDERTGERVNLQGYGDDAKMQVLMHSMQEAIKKTSARFPFVNPWDDENMQFMLDKYALGVQSLNATYPWLHLGEHAPQEADATKDDFADMDLTEWAKEGADDGAEEKG